MDFSSFILVFKAAPQSSHSLENIPLRTPYSLGEFLFPGNSSFLQIFFCPLFWGFKSQVLSSLHSIATGAGRIPWNPVFPLEKPIVSSAWHPFPPTAERDQLNLLDELLN